jgi:hypothetical protein
VTPRPGPGPARPRPPHADDPGRGGAWQGFGHYHERYVKGTDGQWRIREVNLTWLRIDKVEPREPIQHVSIDDSQLERSRHPADT